MSSEPATAEASPPRLDATARLLVLLARDELPASLVAKARALAAQVADWHEFARLAHANFSLPFAYKHLNALGLGQSQPELIGALRNLALRLTMSNLKWQQALIAFHETCIVAARARHSYVKGPALAARYYSDPGLRLCRDIDVLILPNDFANVVRRALDSGFRIVVAFHPELSFAIEGRDIDFMLRHGDVISMLDGNGYLFELHRHIEKMTPIFPCRELVESAFETRLGPSSLSMMTSEWLFNYVAYHHSRHFWSKLHWVADLHAIIGHPSFDRDATLALARRIGIAATVEATLQFADLTGRPEDWERALREQSNGAMLLGACLHGLPGDSSYEFSRWKDMFLFDFEDTWQIDSGRKYRFWAGSVLRRLEPHPTQYFENRRSRHFEFLYRLENALALSRNLIRRATRR